MTPEQLKLLLKILNLYIPIATAHIDETELEQTEQLRQRVEELLNGNKGP